MNKRKICFVIYNRSNYGRLKPLLLLANKRKDIELQIILSSSSVLTRYGNLDQIIIKDGLKINYSFFSHIEGENNLSMTKSTGLIIIELSSILKKLNPDMIVTIGDRYETLATAICGSYMNIFLVHIQGGELTGSVDEKIRHAITKLSNLHLVNTIQAKKIICQLGENPKTVINVGCPSIDIIKKINFNKKLDLQKYNFGVGFKADLKKKYYVVLFHPNTELQDKNNIAIKNLLKIINYKGVQTIWLWPNNDAGSHYITSAIRVFREKNPENKINFYKNFEPEDYIKLIKDCSCLIGNSSSGIRESSYLGIPVVNIGDRQSNRERGNNVYDCSEQFEDILYAINRQDSKSIKSTKIYGTGNSSKLILKQLLKVKLQTIKFFNVQK